MRVLVVHNRYSSRVPSGENLAVRDEARWLRNAGIDVHTHEISNDEVLEAGIGRKVGQAASAVWSLPAARRFTRALDDIHPDVVHIHNLFPLLSAGVPWAALRRGVPVAWTAHNRRVTCVIGTNFRDGRPCLECRPGQRAAGIRHGCYGGSMAASSLATAATSVFRALARRRITPVAVSEHVKGWLVDSAGFDQDRVRVKYNGVGRPSGGPGPAPSTGRRFLFAGYLVDYKGVTLLLDAWKRAGDIDAELRFVGDGPLFDDVRAAAAVDPRIGWTPRVPAQQMADLFADARAVVVPSTWEEPFGRTAAEAMAHGRPVVTTGTGGLKEVVTEETGWTTGRDPDRLARALLDAASSDEQVDARGHAGRERYTRFFTPEATTAALVSLYEELAA